MANRYMITPVTYTATIYFLFRFWSGLCRHHRMPKLTIIQLIFIGPESEGEKSVPVLQCGDLLMQVKTCSVGLARSLSPLNEQMFMEEMVEQLNTVCRELRLASVADR